MQVYNRERNLTKYFVLCLCLVNVHRPLGYPTSYGIVSSEGQLYIDRYLK